MQTKQTIKDLFDKLNKLEDVEDKINYISCIVKGYSRKKYINFDEFDKFLIDVLNLKVNNSRTEAFPLMMLNAHNLLYIDLDFLTTNINYKELNTNICNFMKDVLTKLFPQEKIFGFIPASYPQYETRYKCGFHGFVFYSEILTQSRREKIRLDLLQAIENSELGEYIMINKEFLYQNQNDTIPINSIEQIIDAQVLLNGKHPTIIPFVKKDTSARDYKLLFLYNITRETTTLLIKPTAKELIECEGVQKNINLDNVMEFNELRKLTPDNLRKYIRQQLENIHNEYSASSQLDLVRVEMFLFDCMSGLSSMCENHYVIKIFSKGSWAKNNVFVFKLMKLYFAMYLITISEIETDLTSYMTDILYLILSPLFIRGNKTDSSKIKEDLKSCIDYFNRSDIEHRSYFNSITNDQLVCYKKVLKNDKDDKPTEEDYAQYYYVKSFLRNQIAEFVVYITENVYQVKYLSQEDMKQGDRILKNEIEPFKYNDYKRDIENFSFEDLRSDLLVKKYYDTQIQNIIKLILFCKTWEDGLDCTDRIILKILSILTGHYIYATKDSNSDKQKTYTIYIYNIKQSHSLESLPYNQWIIDNSDYLTEWLTNLYIDFIEPLQDETSFNKFGGIGYVLRLIHDIHRLRIQRGYNFMLTQDSSKNIIKKKKDPKTFIQEIQNNIVQFYNHVIDRINPKVYEPNGRSTNYFSVRNGIIRYKTINNGEWTYDFTTDNRDIILNAFTLAKYEPNYGYENEIAYRELDKILHDIYPCEDEFEYMMNLFSTAFCPSILKDQLVFAWGTGSDGKSTISRLLGTILGNTNIELHVIDSNNEQITLKNPSGYCGTFKPQCLQESTNSSNANEGGIVAFDRKTFVVAQEPPKGKIHSEIVKDFTSGGISNGRKLYEGNKSFVINTLCVIETNTIPQFDVVDDAIRRRVIVYKHHTKFITSATNQYKNRKKEEVKLADSEVINNIIQDTNYWTALLMMMLRRVIKLRNTAYKDDLRPNSNIYVSQLSHIPKPYSVKLFTDNVFSKTTGVSKYLQENLINTSEFGAIFVNELIEKILRDDIKQRKLKGVGILDSSRSSNEKRKEIQQIIDNVYADRLFKIREELIYNNTEKGMKLNKHKIESMKEGIMKLTVPEIIERLTNKNSIISMDEGNDANFRDIIIPGVNFNDDEEESEDVY